MKCNEVKESEFDHSKLVDLFGQSQRQSYWLVLITLHCSVLIYWSFSSSRVNCSGGSAGECRVYGCSYCLLVHYSVHSVVLQLSRVHYSAPPVLAKMDRRTADWPTLYCTGTGCTWPSALLEWMHHDAVCTLGAAGLYLDPH